MKKLILLGLMAIGVGMGGTLAQAGGITVFVSPFRVPVFVPPAPILAPAVVVSTGCAYPVVVRGPVCAPGYRPAFCGPVVYRGGFDHRPVICRDAHFRHDRF
jgi:hypothetical protein